MLKRIIIFFSSILFLCFTVDAAQSPEELTGVPIRSFYNDFECYETNMQKMLEGPSGYKYSSRVTNGRGGTSSSAYTANAAENIPVFNNNLIRGGANSKIDVSTNMVVVSGRTATQYAGEPVTLFITYKDFLVDNPERSKIHYIYEDVVGDEGNYRFEVPWSDTYGSVDNYDIKVFAGDLTSVPEQTEDYSDRIAVYNPLLSEYQYEEIKDNVYKAEGPNGNVVYGGLDGYYGWYGGGLFSNYPDPYGSGFKVDLEPRTSLGPNEQRLAVINEVKGDGTSNKLLIMDALFLGGNTNNKGGGCSQTAVFGKHNLDFSGNTVIEFRLYPYLVGGSGNGFKMYLTYGDYNMSYEPAFVFDKETGLSYEYHSSENYTGSYFPDEQKYELFRLSDSDLTNGEDLYMFKIAGAENRVSGYELVSYANTLATSAVKGDVSTNLPADKFYDIKIEMDRYDGNARLYFEIKDVNGDVIFSTAPNGIAWNVPNLGEFLGVDGQKYGIVFEAHSSAWAGPSERTKVGIDNLKFYKKDYCVRNAWLSSKNGVGSVNVDIYNYSQRDTKAILYAAIYDKQEQALKAVVTKDIGLNATDILAENVVLDQIELPKDYNEEEHIVKLFAWQPDNSLQPIMECVKIDELY